MARKRSGVTSGSEVWIAAVVEEAMRSVTGSTLKKGDKIPLKVDDTFEITCDNAKLGFRLHLTENYIECSYVRTQASEVALEGKSPSGWSASREALSRISGPDLRVAILNPDLFGILNPDLRSLLNPDLHGVFEGDFESMRKPGGTIMFSTVLDNEAKLNAGVTGLCELSQNVLDSGGVKPTVMIPVAGKNETERKSRASRVRAAVRELHIDAHVLMMPGIRGRSL
jgi:hypothetical protein